MIFLFFFQPFYDYPRFEGNKNYLELEEDILLQQGKREKTVGLTALSPALLTDSR